MRRTAAPASTRGTPPPELGDDEAGDDVVEAPPGGDQRHPAEAVEVGEHQQQPEAGVADADLERHRLAAAGSGSRVARAIAVAEREGQRVWRNTASSTMVM